MEDANGTTQFNFDTLGRLKFTIEPTGIKKLYAYNQNDKVTNYQVIQGDITLMNVNYEYSLNGLLGAVAEEGTRFTYAYDEAGKLKEEENTLTGLKSTYDYYPSGQLKSLNHYQVTDLLKSYNYTYDLRGNQTEKDDNGKITAYTYDPLGRLKTADLSTGLFQEYTYDDESNREKLVEMDGAGIRETSYYYDKDNRLLFTENLTGNESIQQRMDYDPEGNMITKQKLYFINDALMSDKSEQMTYNGYNQLTQFQSEGGSLYTYSYDYKGLRTKKSWNEGEINYLSEGGNIILEFDKDMQQTAKNLRGQKLIYRETQKGYTGYIHNGHGDVTALTDNMGNIMWDYEYDPFGRDLNPKIQGFGDNPMGSPWMNEVLGMDNPFQYAGEYKDAESDLYYLRARYYDPEIGRFMTRDTYEGKLQDPMSLNLFTYCRNQPIDRIDPSGHEDSPFFSGGGGAALGGGIFVRATLTPEAQVFYEKMMLRIQTSISSPELQTDLYSLSKDLGDENHLGTMLDLASIAGNLGFGFPASKIIKTFESSNVFKYLSKLDGSKIGLKTTLDYVKDFEKINGKYFAPKNVIDEIGKIEAKGIDFSDFTKKVISTRKSTEGGFSTVYNYSDSSGVKFVIHEVTDAAGNILHRDFDAVRIDSGQLINKLPK